jgi:3-hydroxyacyl-CoA dehydrogenase/enoyl-CoA hydratase/3-hydroxybutyryl-CoA epimerase
VTVPAFQTSVVHGVAQARFDLPGESVNKFTRAVREELDGLLTAWTSDSSIRAVVLLSGKPDTFIAGADIEEFVRLTSVAEARELVRTGQGLINRLADLNKPVVAAIHGACVGGGFEAALACTYRIATDHPKTVIGLPEVQIGILPAAGGCQRLPRLAGVRPALDMILAGKTLPATRALKSTMVDEVVHPAILEDVAMAAARRLADGWRPRRRSGGLSALLMDRTPLGRRLVFELARRGVLAKTRGQYPAPLAALRAIAHGLTHGIEAGLDMEAALFAELAVGEVSRNLVRLFFATTALKKDPGVSGTAPAPRQVENLAMVGAGFMGAAIGGVAAAQASVDVRFRDTDLARVGRGLAVARGILDDRLKRRRVTRFEHRRLVALLSGGTAYEGFGRADLVIEAVFEDLQVKHEVIRSLEAAVRDDCVIASNTSTIPISRIAEAASRPERVLGMHFFSPVEKMPLLEVIAGERTSAWATVTAVAFGRRMGKTVIVVRDRPGFWVNRILAPYLNEAGRLLEEGMAIEELDAIMVRFGFPVGPLTLLDEVGLDVAAKSAAVLHEAFGERLVPTPGVKHLTERGRLGRKSGCGFYRYEKGRRRGVDPSAYAILGVRPGQAVGPAEAEARMVYALLNEAALAMDEEVVRSARDGDVGAVFGIGYPAFRGGPLRYLDTIGPARAVQELQRLEQSWGERFRPAPLLVRLADAGEQFHAAA